LPEFVQVEIRKKKEKRKKESTTPLGGYKEVHDEYEKVRPSAESDVLEHIVPRHKVKLVVAHSVGKAVIVVIRFRVPVR